MNFQRSQSHVVSLCRSLGLSELDVAFKMGVVFAVAPTKGFRFFARQLVSSAGFVFVDSFSCEAGLSLGAVLPNSSNRFLGLRS